MRREIKFRFWSKLLDKMVVPDDSIFVGALKDPQMVVMQYTGLKDKNGVEIYEGDIVSAPWLDLVDEAAVAVVEWVEGGFFYRWSNGKTNAMPHIEHPYPEVIGNIYEHPELLKQEASQ